jgi:lysophospholipase L1-like esterase
LVITLAIIVLFAAIAFLVVTHFVIAGPRTKVAVVGDSLTAQATWPMVDELSSRGYLATVAGVNGATITDEARQLESLTLPGGADVIVVALGTNNAFFASVNDDRKRDLEQSKRDVKDTLTRLFDGQTGLSWNPSTQCVVWVNVSDHSPMLSLDKNAPALNKAIEDEAAAARARGDRVYVADWATESRGHADWFLQDGVHLTNEGERAYAHLVRKTVDRC